MKWYNIKKINDVFYVFKNVQIGKGIGTKQIFNGSRLECKNYCEEKGIKLGLANKEMI